MKKSNNSINKPAKNSAKQSAEKAAKMAQIQANKLTDELSLLADTRESHVLIHKDEFATINLIVKQFDKKGDYILCRNDKIITIFERKTLVDFAASFKDGRSENKQFLL